MHFKLYLALSISKKLAADDDAYLGWVWSKIGLFHTKELTFFWNSKYFSKNIMTSCYLCYFCFFFHIVIFFSNHNAFPLLFLAMISILCLKILTFSNLTIFHSRQSMIILQFILLIAIILFTRGKQLRENKEKIAEAILWLTLLCIFYYSAKTHEFWREY